MQDEYEVQDGSGYAPAKGTQEWAEQVNGTSTDVETPGAAASADTDKSPVAAQPQGAAAEAEPSGTERKIKAYRDWIDNLEPIETPEQRKKRERREKSAKIVSAISDGLRAMGNLYFTSQYAPDMYNHEKSSQLTAQNSAIERARKEREANRDAHFRFALGLADAEIERDKTAREIEAEQERRKLAREKAKREEDAAKAERALDPFRQGKSKAEQEYWEHKAAEQEAKAGVAGELAQAEVDAKKAQGESYKSSAGANNARGRYYDSKTESYTFDGKSYRNKVDYAKAVLRAAREYNDRHPDSDKDGNPVAAVPTTWYKETKYGSEPNLYEAYDIAAQLEPLLEAERKGGKGAGYGGKGKGKGTGYGKK